MSDIPADSRPATEEATASTNNHEDNQKKPAKKKSAGSPPLPPSPAKQQEKPEQDSGEPEVTRSKGSGGWLAILALLVAGAAAGLGAYNYWLFQIQEQQRTQLAETQNAQEQRLVAQADSLRSLRDTLSAETAEVAALRTQQEALNTAWENMSASLGRSNVAWRLAEVEYLLSIASHRLVLARDRETTISIFNSADQRLRAMGDPRLLPVRREIADALNDLRAMQEPDIAGIALTLGSLIDRVSELPLIDTQRIATATEIDNRPAPASWRELPRAIWEDIKSLVQVRRHQQPVEPLLPPQQAWYLYQNLQLKLEQARLAALQRNTALFRQQIAAADLWLMEFFDQGAHVVNATRQSLNEFSEVELNPGLPDVSGPLLSLREFMAHHAATSAQEPATAPASSPLMEGPPES